MKTKNIFVAIYECGYGDDFAESSVNKIISRLEDMHGGGVVENFVGVCPGTDYIKFSDNLGIEFRVDILKADLYSF